jgi:hypothetical protein
MEYSFFNRIRDILLLGALLLLAKTAFERTSSFIKLHEKSMVHELDRSFIDQIYTAQRQLHFLEEHPAYSNDYAHDIADIKKQLTTIEEKYKKNSPGLALLGPIGSAAIVIKEKELQEQLLVTINDLSIIFAQIHNVSDKFQLAQTINDGLESNKKLLRTLLA